MGRAEGDMKNTVYQTIHFLQGQNLSDGISVLPYGTL